MAKIKSVKFNFIMNSILTASSMIFPLITFTYVSRILGPGGTGTVSFANSIVTYFSMFAQLGVPTYGIRACAIVRDDKVKLSRTVHEIMIINFATCVLSYCAFFLAIFCVERLRTEKTLFVLMGTLILFNTIGAEWLYKGLEQYSYITIRSLVFKIAAVVGMLALIREKDDYLIYGVLTIFAAAGSNVLNFLNLRKVILVRPLGPYNLKKHIRPISVFFAMSIATTIYTNLDNVMIGFMSGTVENGYYDAAVRIKNVLVSFVASLGTVLLPRMSYYIEVGDKEEFHRLTKKALNFVLVLSIPLCVYFMLFAKPSIYLLSGEMYRNAILPMRIILPTLVFIGLTNIIGLQMLVPLGREKEVLYSEVVGAVIDLVLNACLIPRMGAAGAAVGTVAAELAVFVVQVVFLRDQVIPILKRISYYKILAATLAASAASVWLLAVEIGVFWKLFISACLFFGVYGIILILEKEDIVIGITMQFLNIVKKRSK